MKFRIWSSLPLAAAAIAGMTACSDTSDMAQGIDCSAQWYEKVERIVPGSDTQGHGPDLGSSEWRSSIEFRLGIRGNSDIPSVNSEEWCSFIASQLDKQDG